MSRYKSADIHRKRKRKRGPVEPWILAANAIGKAAVESGLTYSEVMEMCAYLEHELGEAFNLATVRLHCQYGQLNIHRVITGTAPRTPTWERVAARVISIMEDKLATRIIPSMEGKRETR